MASTKQKRQGMGSGMSGKIGSSSEGLNNTFSGKDWTGFKEQGHPLLQARNQKIARQNAADARNQGFARAEETYAAAPGSYDSYRQLGTESVSAVQKLFGDPGSVKGLPGYKFRYETGQNAVETAAASKGKLFSGQTLQELVRYGQEFATAEYDNELKRRMSAVTIGLQANKGYDEASFNLAEIQAGRGQAAARQFEDEGKYLAGFEQSGRDMFGSWFGGSGPFGQATGASMGSDRSIKENIVLIGKHLLGIGLYLFNYKQPYKETWGHGRYLGVMADEVVTVMPEAVSTHPDGYKMVNYAMLGLEKVHTYG